MERANSADEEILHRIIAGGPYAGEDAGVDEDVSSYLNPSGDGMELEPFNEGQTNNDDEGNIGPLTTSGEVYILMLDPDNL